MMTKAEYFLGLGSFRAIQLLLAHVQTTRTNDSLACVVLIIMRNIIRTRLDLHGKKCNDKIIISIIFAFDCIGHFAARVAERT